MFPDPVLRFPDTMGQEDPTLSSYTFFPFVIRHACILIEMFDSSAYMSTTPFGWSILSRFLESVFLGYSPQEGPNIILSYIFRESVFLFVDNCDS